MDKGKREKRGKRGRVPGPTWGARPTATSDNIATMVSQGSADMSLKCVRICNDHFVANSVLSLAVKEFPKIAQYFAKLSTRVGRLFVDSHCT